MTISAPKLHCKAHLIEINISGPSYNYQRLCKSARFLQRLLLLPLSLFPSYTRKEVINIATAFVPGHRKGQNFAHEWAGSRLIPRVKMEVSGDPPPASFRGKSRRTSSGLGRTEGGLQTILSQSRNVLPNGEDTLRISVALARGLRVRVGRATRPSSSPSKRRRVREASRAPSLFFWTTARVRTYVPIPLRSATRARGYYTRADGFRFFACSCCSARRKRTCLRTALLVTVDRRTGYQCGLQREWILH